MSIEHRNNPDSEECRRMAKDNEIDIKVRQHMHKIEHSKPRRMRYYCNDRTCGGEDCLTCYPGNRDIDLEENE